MTECSILTSQAINVTVGEPLHVQCWSNCSLPIDPIVWKKKNTVIYWHKMAINVRFTNLTDRSCKQNKNYTIQLAASMLMVTGKNTCIKMQKGSPDTAYKSSFPTKVPVNQTL